MSIEDLVVGKLKGTSDVTTALTGGIHVTTAPETAKAPFAVLTFADGGKERVASRDEFVSNVTCDVYSAQKAAGRAAIDACRAALQSLPRSGNGCYDAVASVGEVSTRPAGKDLFQMRATAKIMFAAKKIGGT